jgi:hypothetical protein
MNHFYFSIIEREFRTPRIDTYVQIKHEKNRTIYKCRKETQNKKETFCLFHSKIHKKRKRDSIDEKTKLKLKIICIYEQQLKNKNIMHK